MRRIAPGTASLPPERLGCEDYASDVTLYVDGELGEGERTALEAHLDHCASCRRGSDFSRRLQEAVREKAGDAAAPGTGALRSRILVSLDAEPAPATVSHRLLRFFRPLPVAAAGATAMGVTAWLWFVPPPDDVLRDVVARHARRLPMEIQSSDPQSLELWLADKVDFHVHVPRIENQPLNLLGARLSHVKDRSAVYLLYGNAQSPPRRVSLIVYDDDAQAAPPIEGQPVKVADREVYTANRAGYNVAVWRRDEVVYSLVSDGEEDVLELVRVAAER